MRREKKLVGERNTKSGKQQALSNAKRPDRDSVTMTSNEIPHVVDIGADRHPGTASISALGNRGKNPVDFTIISIFIHLFLNKFLYFYVLFI